MVNKKSRFDTEDDVKGVTSYSINCHDSLDAESISTENSKVIFGIKSHYIL